MRTTFFERILKFTGDLTKNPVAHQVSMQGRARPMGLEIRRTYSQLFPNMPDPAYTEYKSSAEKEIQVKPFLDMLEKDGWQKISQERIYVLEEGFYKDKLSVYAKDPGYILVLAPSYKSNEGKKKRSKEKLAEIKFFDDILFRNQIGKDSHTDEIMIYHPNMWDVNYKEEELNKISEYFKNCIVPDSGNASIGIISSSQGEYYVKDFSLEGKTPEFTHPDLHYGPGFLKFHEDLCKRINENTKGLILFHGEPGTGKTQYIRILLKNLAAMNKTVLYAPPSVSASMMDPQMIEWLSSWVLDSDKDCILLIEDAEPLLETRKGSDGRTTGISNLLNVTDGLLNDILGLMVIATFNTEIDKIDKALLRPQRLLARKEFKKITKEQAEVLAKTLGIDIPETDYPASLADFYAEKQDRKVITHGLDSPPPKIGFRTSKQD